MHDPEYFAELIDELTDVTGDKKFKCKRCDVVSKYKVQYNIYNFAFRF
jgi:uncharacterized C2H2 Zn-finger protein